jgi:hypothetical protein
VPSNENIIIDTLYPTKQYACSGKPEDHYWRDSMVSTKLSDPFQTIDVFAKESHFIRTNVVAPYTNDTFIWRFLDFEIPRHFTKQIEDINSTFGQQQIENIHYTISLIDKQPKQDKLDQLVKQNITKCINWCMEHTISYNNLVNANIFEPKNITISTTDNSSSDLISLFHG